MQQEDQIIRTIEMEEAFVGLRKDGIVHVYYKRGTVITVDVQNRIYQIFHEITGGRKTPFIFEAAEYCTVTKEARDNAIATEDITPTGATVVFVHNLAYRMVAEFYYKFNKPKQPYKVSTDFQEGIDWLLSLNDSVD